MKFTDTWHRVAVAAAFVLAGPLALLFTQEAQAEAPMVKTQAPGFYRMMLGDFEITALSDGSLDLPVRDLLSHTTPAQVDKALARSFLHAPVETSVNAYLVNTGSKLILIDAGAAGLFGPTLGKLAVNLQAAGYKPEQVDEIYITHLHPDHVGGLMSGDKIAFPNAVVRVDKHDLDFWLDEESASKAPASAKTFFHAAMVSLSPYIAAGRLKPIDGNSELSPGISVVNTLGHTPGHSSFVVESKGQKLVIWGDLLHVAAVQFDSPSVTIQFDSDMTGAEKARRKALIDAAQNGYLVAAAHVAFPGIGHVRAQGTAFAWVPVNYTVPR
jgi:glyoxylase-like metal-dependent hydrolase (beta-lactamase superfamily II)